MEKQAVLCSINQQSFAIDLNIVREIVKMSDITPLPESPRWVLGVTKLREEVILLLDGEMILGTGKSKVPLKERKIAVLLLDNQCVGLVVDDIDEVYKYDFKDLQEIELLGITAKVIRRDNQLFVLIDQDSIAKKVEGIF